MSPLFDVLGAAVVVLKKNLGYKLLSVSKFECNVYGVRNTLDKFHRNNLKEIKTSWYDLYAA